MSFCEFSLHRRVVRRKFQPLISRLIIAHLCNLTAHAYGKEKKKLWPPNFQKMLLSLRLKSIEIGLDATSIFKKSPRYI